MTALALKDHLKPAFLQRVPRWLWPGWVIHLSSYTLPSFRIDAHQVASGFQCALIAFRMWFSEDGVLGELRNGKLEQVRGAALIGWFNVTNLAAILAPVLLARFAQPLAAWWVALLCATGAVQAAAFGMGSITGEPEAMRLGFYVWLFSYLWLATTAFVIWRRRLRRACG